MRTKFKILRASSAEEVEKSIIPELNEAIQSPNGIEEFRSFVTEYFANPTLFRKRPM